MGNVTIHYFDKIYNRLVSGTQKATREIMKVVEEESKKAYLDKKKKDVVTSGMLFSSFLLSPIRSQGNSEFSGILFVGGPSAPYAPIVEKYGWDTKTGHKEGYGFMKTGAEKGIESARMILDKHLKKV